MENHCKCCKKLVKVRKREVLNRTVLLCDNCYEIIVNLFELLYG